MNRNTSDVQGGVNIKPSARKSIHSHCTKIGCHKNMGKYGLNIRRREEKSDLAAREGVDEVDNVMSKMARQASPVPTRRNNDIICRRNSFDVGTTECTDEESDDDNILSKSSPATFFSEELYTSALQNNLQRSRNESGYSINNSPPRSSNVSSENHHTGYLSTSQPVNIKNKLDNTKQFMIAIFVLVMSIGMILYNQHTSEPIKPIDVYDKFRFYNDVKDLKEKYKVLHNSILQVRTGVATILENQDTASFIFTYNSRNNNFNPMKFDNFIQDIAATASRFLRNESKEIHVTVDPSNLVMQTEKDFMNHYQEGVVKTGVMLVKDIDSIPSQLAMAFHYYCDEYNPLVKQSAIFFTLNLAKCSNSSDQKSTHEYIEKCLAKKWNTVGEDKIGPLLTRVVNIVVDVTQTF